jgi:hypothetical protein
LSDNGHHPGTKLASSDGSRSGYPFAMDTIVFLITISAGVLAFRYKERLQQLAPIRQDQKVLVDRALGLARLELPEGWRPARDLNEMASIEAINALRGRHVIIISDSVDDFVPEMTMLEHSANTRTELANSIKLITCSGPERRTVGGFESVQYEIDAFFQQTRVKYLHTTVAGRRAFHLEQLLNGFTELPDGSVTTQTVAADEPLQIVPASRYEFH